MLTNPGQKTVQPALEAHIHFISVEAFSSSDLMYVCMYLFIYLFIYLTSLDLTWQKGRRDLAEGKATFPSRVTLSQPVKLDMSS